MLSNFDIKDIVEKMEIPKFKGCFFKDELNNIESNSNYIINLHSKYDKDGKINTGSHWVALVTDTNKNSIYFDPYGLPPPKEISRVLKEFEYKEANTKKNIQSLMSNLCGFFCLAFIYFLKKSKQRTKQLYKDTSIFLELFEDLDKVTDIYKNEFMLSLFFTDKESKRLLLEGNNIGLTETNKLPKNFDIENKPLRT